MFEQIKKKRKKMSNPVMQIVQKQQIQSAKF